MLNSSHRIRIEFLQPADLGECERIDAECFGQPMTGNEIGDWRCERGHVGLVAHGPFDVLGYALYARHKEINLIRLAVAPFARGKGVGRAILERLERLALVTEKRRVSALVDEHNNDAIWFFRRCGFKGMCVIRGEEFGSDSYLFSRNAVHSEAMRPIANVNGII